MTDEPTKRTVDPPIVWKPGDVCLLEFDGRVVKACVQLTSNNARSLMLSFEVMLGGYVGAMPLLWYSLEGTYRDLIRWQPAKLTRPTAGSPGDA